jgi:hypothetical protein
MIMMAAAAACVTPHLICWADLLQLLQVLLAQHHAHAANVLLKVPAIVAQQQARPQFSLIEPASGAGQTAAWGAINQRPRCAMKATQPAHLHTVFCHILRTSALTLT